MEAENSLLWLVNVRKSSDYKLMPVTKTSFKLIKKIDESAFNLRKDSKISKIDFDNDEVPVEDIQHSETKFRMQKLVAKMLAFSISQDELSYFQEHVEEFNDDPFYKVLS